MSSPVWSSGLFPPPSTLSQPCEEHLLLS
jgi:hypothetical protein